MATPNRSGARWMRDPGTAPMIPLIGARSWSRERLLGLLRRVQILKASAADTGWGLFDQGVGLIASAFSFLLLGRTLGPSGYGAFIGLYSVIGPVISLTQAGLFLAILEHVKREREDAIEVARSAASITLVNGAVWIPILTAVSWRWIEGLSLWTALVFLASDFWLSGLFANCVGCVQAVDGYAAAARLRIVATLGRVALLVLLAALGSLTLTTLAVGQFATVALFLLVAMTRVSRRIGVPVHPGGIRWRHMRTMFLYGAGIGASSVQSDGDKFALNAAHFQADAGRYGAAYRLMGMVLLPVQALAAATHLSFLDRDTGEHQSRRAARLSLVSLAYAVPAIVGIVVLAPYVPRILTKDFAQTTTMLQLLAPVILLRAVGVFPMNGLMGLGNTGLRTKIALANAVFSVALYAALIPTYSWKGALVATLASEVTLCASGWIALLWCERAKVMTCQSHDVTS